MKNIKKNIFFLSPSIFLISDLFLVCFKRRVMNPEETWELYTKQEIWPKKGVAFVSCESKAMFVDTYGKNQAQLYILILH